IPRDDLDRRPSQETSQVVAPDLLVVHHHMPGPLMEQHLRQIRPDESAPARNQELVAANLHAVSFCSRKRLRPRWGESRYSAPHTLHCACPFRCETVSASVTPQAQIHPRCRAGLPWTSAKSGTSRVTTAPAPTNAKRPMVSPQRMVAFAPTVAPCRTSVGRYSCFREIWLRGLITFVNTTDGPQNTESSRVTPSYTETLFWIFTPAPTTAPGATYTFWPSEQFAPTRAPLATCEKCQMRVSAPTAAGSSTQAVS